MALDLIRDSKRSPKVLRQVLERTAQEIELPLPTSGKTFLAVARLQQFDVPPKVVEKADLDSHIINGCLDSTVV